MPAPNRAKPLKRDAFAAHYKSVKPVLFADSPNLRTAIPPNIRCIAWSPTGSMVATCIHTHIRIWSPDKPNVKSSTEFRNAHPRGGVAGAATGDVVEKVAFCPTTDNLLASVGQDGFVRLWDVRVAGGAVGAGKGVPLADYKAGDQCQFLTWHPSGDAMLVGRRDSLVHAVDLRRTSMPETGTVAYTVDGTERTPPGKATLNAMSFSNSGREVFVTTQNGEVKILDYPSMSLLHTLSGHMAPTYTVQQSPVGTHVAVGSGDSLISMWDTRSWFCTHNITHHSSSVKDLSYSWDGMYVVAGSGTDHKDANHGLDIYFADSGESLYTIETKNQVTHVAWHPQRYWIAYAGEAGGMHIAGAGSSII